MDWNPAGKIRGAEYAAYTGRLLSVYGVWIRLHKAGFFAKIAGKSGSVS